MDKNDEMTVAEKIKAVRNVMGIHQDELAKAANCGAGTISRIENGHSQYTDKQLNDVRKLLGIDNAPLFDSEIVIFRARLYVWRRAMRERRIEDARRMLNELEIITKMLFREQLIQLYKIFEANLMIAEGNVSAAETALEQISSSLKGACVENLYHYYCCVGTLDFYKKDYNAALQSYFSAHDLKYDEFLVDKSELVFALYYNIAYCYAYLGMYVRAIATLERIYELYSFDISNNDGMRADNLLAVNYMWIGDIDRAKHLLNNCMVKARSTSHHGYMGTILHNFGCVHLKLQEYEKALEYFGKAFEYYKKGQGNYLENLYYEILCLIATKSSLSNKRLSYAKSVASNNEHYKLLFDSLEHLTSLKGDSESAKHIEQTTITYLAEKREYFRTIEYCRLLESFYMKKPNRIKALEMKSLAYDIYRKSVEGSEDDEKEIIRPVFGYGNSIEL